jgi:hypothetical protein
MTIFEVPAYILLPQEGQPGNYVIFDKEGLIAGFIRPCAGQPDYGPHSWWKLMGADETIWETAPNCIWVHEAFDRWKVLNYLFSLERRVA